MNPDAAGSAHKITTGPTPQPSSGRPPVPSGANGTPAAVVSDKPKNPPPVQTPARQTGAYEYATLVVPFIGVDVFRQIQAFNNGPGRRPGWVLTGYRQDARGNRYFTFARPVGSGVAASPPPAGAVHPAVK